LIIEGLGLKNVYCEECAFGTLRSEISFDIPAGFKLCQRKPAVIYSPVENEQPVADFLCVTSTVDFFAS